MKHYVSQKEFEWLMERLYEDLESHKDNFKFVLGIVNGGLNVSVPLAKKFNKPHHSVHISFYDGDQKREQPKLDNIDEIKIKSLTNNIEGPFLWVDDIVDSGSTLKWFIKRTGLKMGRDFKVATLHWCQENSPDLKPNFFCELKDKKIWIVYPWEV